VEMSCGIGHQCITIGIAEAIAIKTMTTANIFAISSRLWPGFGLFRLIRLRATAWVLYFGLKVKLALAAALAATVTFWV
jgi:hypothetical protein